MKIFFFTLSVLLNFSLLFLILYFGINFNDLFVIFKKIPSSIWSVTFGALLTFFSTTSVVIITNKHSNNQLQKQLNHEIELKEIERKEALRRDIYLNAIEEFVKIINFTISIPQLDFINPENINKQVLEDYFIANAKLELVAEDETVQSSNKFMNKLILLIQEALALSEPLLELKSENKGFQISIDSLNNYVNQKRELILIEKGKSVPDSQVLIQLQTEINIYNDEILKISEKITENSKKITKETIGFSKIIIDKVDELREIRSPVLTNIRKELGINTNIELYEKNINDEIIKYSKNFLDTIEKKAD